MNYFVLFNNIEALCNVCYNIYRKYINLCQNFEEEF